VTSHYREREKTQQEGSVRVRNNNEVKKMEEDMKKHNRKNKVEKKRRKTFVRKPRGKTPFRKPEYSF